MLGDRQHPTPGGADATTRAAPAGISAEDWAVTPRAVREWARALEQRGARLEEQTARALAIRDVDNMNPYDFERYVSRLLEHRGYQTKIIGGAGDLGVDLIAQKDRLKFAVQAKLYATPVSRRAVSDAVAGKDHYGCNAAMVVTNGSFTRGARALARSTECSLVGRKTLVRWIFELQHGLGKTCPSCA